MLVVFLVSCEQKFEVEEPEILSVSYEPESPVTGEWIQFTIEANADLAVIWAGDEGRDYEQHSSSPRPDNVGNNVPLELDLLNDIYVGTPQIQYDSAGTFNVVIIVSNPGDFGETILTDMEEVQVTVTQAPEEE